MEEYSCLKECPLAAEVCNHRKSEPPSPRSKAGIQAVFKKGERARESGVRCFRCDSIQGRRLVTKVNWLSVFLLFEPCAVCRFKFPEHIIEYNHPLDHWRMLASWSSALLGTGFTLQLWLSQLAEHSDFLKQQPTARGILFQRGGAVL